MMLFTESTLSRLRSGDGAGSSSGLKEVVELEGLPISGERSAGEGEGEANGDLIVFTRLLTLSRFREGDPECSGGSSCAFESEENGEKTGERNGEGSGTDIARTGYLYGGGSGEREVREVSVVFIYLPSENVKTQYFNQPPARVKGTRRSPANIRLPLSPPCSSHPVSPSARDLSHPEVVPDRFN